MADCLLCPDYDRSKDKSEVASLKCGHSFCWTCLNDHLKKNMNCKIRCPETSCIGFVSDIIIRKTLSPEEICKYEYCCLNIPKQIHNCLLPQCTGSICFTDPNLQYQCSVCSLYNCVLCRAAHCYYNCTQYRALSINQQQGVCKEELVRAWKVFKKSRCLQMRNILLKEDKMDVLSNEGVFTCGLVCGESKAKKKGLKIRFCQHTFCEDCLKSHIETSDNASVKCPHENCGNTLSDREIQGILPLELLIIYLSKCNNQLKSKLRNYVQCKYPDCGSLYNFSVRPSYFTCTNCKQSNCVTCNEIHSPENCNNRSSRTNNDKFIENEIRAKRLMRCLDCNQLLNKTSGCNWISCPGCGVELCWITQNYRWGRNGPGDTSGGCKCGVNGKRCSPECTKSCTPHLNHPSYGKYLNSVQNNTLNSTPYLSIGHQQLPNNTQDNSGCVIT